MDEEEEDSTGLFALRISGTPAARGARQPHLALLAGPEGLAESFPLAGTVVIGRGSSAGVRLQHDGVSRQHARVVVDGDRIVVQDLGSRNGTHVNGERVDAVTLVEGDTIQVGAAVLRLVYRDSLEAKALSNLRETARRDALTGAYNRRYFDERLEAEIAYAKRHQKQVAVVLIDVDFFKKVNDTLGHPAGDAVLRSLCEVVSAQIRREDVLARYGGEEFVVVCRDTSPEGAVALAERFRAAVEAAKVSHEGRPIAVTISLGVATGPRESDASSAALVARADQALYDSKRAGRNRVTYRAD